MNNNFLMKIKKHEIYILTRGRTKFLLAMIESLLNQKCSGFEIFISDNREELTESERVERDSIIQKHPQINYINRKNCNSIWLHTKECALNSNADLITILHDDDCMHEDYVCWVQQKFSEYENAGAVAPNSFIINQEFQVIGSAIYDEKDLFITTRELLLLRYFSPLSKMHPSFPFYTYRTEVLKSSLSDALTVGNYSDIELLIKIIDSGSALVWGSDKKAYYRVHGANLSSVIHLEDRKKLLEYIRKVGTKASLDAYKGWLVFELFSMTIKGTSILKVFQLIKNLNLMDFKSIGIAFLWFVRQIKRKVG